MNALINRIIQAVIKNAGEMKEVIVAANLVTNNQFEQVGAKLLHYSKSINHQSQFIKKMRLAIKASPLPQADKEVLANLDDASVYNFARQLILQYLRKEIKTPLRL